MAGDVQILGLKELEEMLLKFPAAIQNKIGKAALINGLKPTVDEIKSRCPPNAESRGARYPHKSGKVIVQPGDLKKKGFKIRIFKEKQSANRLTAGIYVSQTYWYWRLVEYGHVNASKRRTTSERKIEMKDWKGGYTPAHPFVRPAESAARAKSLEAFKSYMAARINVASNGGKWVSMKNFIKSNGA